MRKNQPLLNDISEMILDPLHREVEPKIGQKGYVRFFTQPSSINEQERTIRFRCSTNNVDRYSEIVDPQAFKKWLPVFESNPVFIAGHIYVAPDGKPTTIGNWRDLRITDDALEATAWFMENDDLAEPYWRRYQAGVQKAVSVGFITHAFEMREMEFDGQKQRVRVFTDVELVEISAVAIPANRESLVRAASAYSQACLQADTQNQAPGDLDQRIEAAIDKSLTKLLSTNPGGRLCNLIADVAESLHAHGGLGVDEYLGDPSEPRTIPDPDDDYEQIDRESALKGDDELHKALRDVLDKP